LINNKLYLQPDGQVFSQIEQDADSDEEEERITAIMDTVSKKYH